MSQPDERKRRFKQSNKRDLALKNLRFARRHYALSVEQTTVLRQLTEDLQLSVALGDLRLLEGNWYVTLAGLLRIAQRNRCSGIQTAVVKGLSDPNSGRWVFKATVYKTPRSRAFIGFGDADRFSVPPSLHGAVLRVAESRAIARAIRRAFGIGLCSVEELGWQPRSFDFGSSKQNKVSTNGNNDHQRSQPRLRDQLCLLIRKYRLDAGLVKAFAADFCNVSTLRDATREQVEAFINKLAESAATDREALICRLNGYARQPEANS